MGVSCRVLGAGHAFAVYLGDVLSICEMLGAAVLRHLSLYVVPRLEMPSDGGGVNFELLGDLAVGHLGVFQPQVNAGPHCGLEQAVVDSFVDGRRSWDGSGRR
ncbi:hypothetical protein CH299_28835 [Rhodococcus sp. 14-2686-1-2]|nr:hypothetical protein CH301_28320 [Rhodococcus sp. 15-1189-1-1a]OZF08170.1 hypothetical protein CH299_28835 [Rhodococcus sp. 14-2686-1-2]